jgi:signal transduction histidine kinase/DNA-binding response OmpR family regulator
VSTETQETTSTDVSNALVGQERARALLAVGTAAFLYPAFGLLDWLVYPEMIGTSLTIRFVVSAVYAVIFFALLRVQRLPSVIALSSAAVVIGGAGIALMVHLTEGVESPYYAGLSLVLVFGAVWFTWPLWVSAVNFGLILISYYGPVLLYEKPVDMVTFTSNSFFLLSTAAVGLIAIRLRNRLARAELQSRIELAQSADALRRTNQLKDEMFQNVSHELRTPLTLILSPLEQTLEEEGLGERMERRLLSMRRNGLRLLNLINDLLDLAKLGSEGISVEARRLNIPRMVRRLAEDVREMSSAKGLELELELPDDPVHYRLDPHHIERIVLNLLSNALKFTPVGGTVTVRVREDDAGLAIQVADTGIGIPEDAQQRIFERFQQVEGGVTRRFGGTGIGLALVAELSKLMEGRIDVESVVNEGTTFTVRFPRKLKVTPRSGDSEAPAAEPTSDIEPTSVAALGRRAVYASLSAARETGEVRRLGEHGPVVLVAEDDPELNQEICELISEEYRVLSVADGERALEVAVEEEPHVVLSDVMMPKMDGLALTAALRERPSFRDTPIILLSARGELEDRIKGRQAGVDTYLTKPFHPRELRATIEGVLRSRMKLVGSFLLHNQLGSGGQATVYLAEQWTTGKPIALKIISQRGAFDSEARKRAAKEQETLSRIEHPNIVRVLEQGRDEDRFYVAMEYLSGATARELVTHHQQVDPAVACTVGEAVSEALSAIHEAGLVHRDVKCANIMILHEGETLKERVRLIDFGAVFDEAPDESGPQIVGTLPYLTPDVLDGEPSKPADDVYALGVALFYMCTGRLPYRGANRTELTHAIRHDPIPRARDFNPDVPPDLDRIIARAMDRDVEARWPSAAELSEALAKLGLTAQEIELPVGAADQMHLMATRTA